MNRSAIFMIAALGFYAYMKARSGTAVPLGTYAPPPPAPYDLRLYGPQLPTSEDLTVVPFTGPWAPEAYPAWVDPTLYSPGPAPYIPPDILPDDRLYSV